MMHTLVLAPGDQVTLYWQSDFQRTVSEHLAGPRLCGEPAHGPIYPTTPMCPRCGLIVRFTRASEFVGDLVPLECGCGWRGRAPVAQ